MSAIFDYHRKQYPENKELPVIYPLIFYTGDKTYTASTDFFTLFNENETLMREIFAEPFQLIDVNQVADEELRQYLLAGTLSMVMQKTMRKSTLKALKTLADRLRDLDLLHREFVLQLFQYIFAVSDNTLSFTAVETFIHQCLPESLEEPLMSLAERLRQEGVDKGRQEGMQQGMQEGIIHSKVEIARRLLQKGSDLDFIIQVTDLDRQTVEALIREQQH